jgi:hypothetical protein
LLSSVEGRRGPRRRGRRGADDRAHRGAIVQSLSGFGFALLVRLRAPERTLLTATIGAPEAVPTITITGIPCNVADLVLLNHLRAGTR